MRKLKILVIGIIFTLGLFVNAPAGDFRIAGSLNYYAVTDSLFKDIYGSGNLMFGGSLSYEVIGRLELRAEAHYFREQGNMTLTEEDIKLTLMPIILGMRFQFIKLSTFSPYVGAGVDFYSYKEDVPNRLEDVSESTIGFHAEAGSYLNITRKFYVDLNFRYIKADAKPFDETIKLGGVRTGVGFGFRF